jgi:hypothetical protein
MSAGKIIKIYGNGWFNNSFIPDEIITSNCIVIVDEFNVLENIEKDDGIDIIYIQIEPKAIMDQTLTMIRNAHKCLRIYTYDDDVIGNCKNARKYAYGTTWIPKDYYLNINKNKKQFMASVIVGSKNVNNASGHLFRQAIYHHQNIFLSNDLKLAVYISSRQKPMLELKNDNKVLSDDKTELFDKYQYSIIIENERQPNYFSEKLVDCLITQTIPIYYGCNNIFAYFDTSYWIVLNNTDVNELNNKLKQLKPEHYEKNYEKIKKNYDKCMNYVSLKDNLKNAE